MDHQRVHLIDHQGGAVVQHPIVDGARISGAFQLVPKHAIVQIVKSHEVVGIVDVNANVESSDEQILRDSPANLDVEEVVGIRHR